MPERRLKTTPMLMTIGYLMLTAGIALYIRLVLTGKGAMWHSFLLLMGCLMFFNLPAVLARRRDQKNERGESAPED